MYTSCRRGIITALTTLALPARAQRARVQHISQSQFRAGAGRITSEEVPQGTRNPIYPPALYGAPPLSPTVRFGGYLRGRGIARPMECPQGAAPTGCLAGTPRGPVSLDADSPPVFTRFDAAPAVNSVQLSGTPLWNGPVAMVFSRDVAAVGLMGGQFNAAGGTAISVYARDGTLLGMVSNRGLGQEFLGLVTSDLAESIAALEFHLVGPEGAGFGVDNVTFGDSAQVDAPDARPAEKWPPPIPPRDS